MYYIHLEALERYLSQVVNGSTQNFADLWFIHTQLRSLYVSLWDHITHDFAYQALSLFSMQH